MKFPLSWLKRHLETDATLSQVVEKLTVIGLEVESVDDKAALKPFTIARVISANPHPNADRLRVCMVDTGSGDPVQVVCGAPNARTGMMGVFAPVSTHIPGTGVDLKAGVIRDVASNGMLCSERELQISDDHEGIIDLPENAPLGKRYIEWAGLDDPVIEIAITPNRPDAAGVYGIARDLSAAGLGKHILSDPKPVAGEFDCPISIELEFEGDTQPACPLFVGRLIRNVKNGPSPQWMQDRLRAVGLRPINALVDITNFLTHDRARPLHVYDADKLSGAVRARMGRQGESFLALDGKTYKADESTCVIADDSGVLGFGGIIGGESTGCDETTTNVLLECAYFEPRVVAQAGRKAGIISDARFRFERGVDPEFVVPGAELATKMIMDICGGQPSKLQIAGQVPSVDRIIDFPTSEVKRLIGIDIPANEIRAILTMLGFWVSASSSEAFKVAVPSWRPDVMGKADLVEEVMRIYGIENLNSEPLSAAAHIKRDVISTNFSRGRATKRALAARGLNECVSWSFISHAHAKMFGGGGEDVTLANPISLDMSHMRPSLLPGLLLAMQRNANRGYANSPLFEVGPIFSSDKPDGQHLVAAGIRPATAAARGTNRHWQVGAQQASLYDAKADLFAALEACGLAPDRVQLVRAQQPHFHPGRSGQVQLGPKNLIGVFGELHPATLAALDVEGPVVAFEMRLEAIPLPKARRGTSKGALEKSDFMPVRRDFAFVVDETVEAGAVAHAARTSERKLIRSVTIFDVFRGKGIAEGQKSVAIEVTLQPAQQTLTDEQISAVSQKIIEQVQKNTGGMLRG